MTAGYNVERDGRLVFARVHVLASVAEVQSYFGACAAEIRLAGRRPLLLADHRPAVVYSPAVTDALFEAFRTNNDLLERVAILVSPANAVLQMQLNRITRDAGGSKRRVFQDPGAALGFLADLLSEPEARAVTAFFA
jgi:hypothetical protein